MEPPDSVAEGVQAPQPKRSNVFIYHAVCSALILLVAVILRAQQTAPTCADKLNDGRWLTEGVWQPNHCTLHQYQWSEVEKCVSQFSRVVVVGFDNWSNIVHLFCPTHSDKVTGSHSCIMGYIGRINTCTEDEGLLRGYADLTKYSEDKGPVLVIHQPQFHLSPVEDGKNTEALSRCRGLILEQVRAQERLLVARPGSLVVQLDSNPAWQSGQETGADATHLYREIYNSAQQNTSGLIYLTSPFETGFSQRLMVSLTQDSPPPPELSLLLNIFCVPPPSFTSSSASCCVHHSHYLATAILIFIIAAYVGVGLILLSGATFALTPHLEAINFDLDRFVSVLHSIGGGALVLFYILIVDGVGYFSSEERGISPWLFGVCVATLFVVAALTSEKTETSEFLSANQCNEWRGMLIVTYIALHYCGIDQVGAGQLVGELLVGGLVFISGFTHFTHCWKHADFSWRRLGTVLLRLNVLPVLLCMTLGTPYAAYTLPVLLSLAFLFTVSFMASWPLMTPASLQGMSVQGPQHVVVAVKFGFAFLFISFLPWMKGVVKGLVSLPLLGMSKAGADTLYHWIYTQRYMALGGMALGYVLCSVQSNSASAASDGFRRLKLVTTAFSVLILIGYGTFLASATDFEESFDSQSLIAQPVILSYSLLRYFSKPLRRYESPLLAQLGSSSVWLFISYHHILLAQSGTSLLALFPLLPLPVNSAIALCVFFFCHQLMNFAQHTLSNYFKPCTSTATGTSSRTLPMTVP